MFEISSTEQEVERLRNQAKQRNLQQWYIDRLPSEAPRHRVRLTHAFYLGYCEVTQAQYEQVTGSNPSWFRESGADAPVEQVSWDDAAAYCQRLSALPAEKGAGRVYRLPTEAEWEYAARAGTTTVWSFGDDEAALSEHAWWGGNSGGKTHAVGQKRPNGFLLFDVHGNVWEWCADRFAADYDAKSPTNDPVGPESGWARGLRGGSGDNDYSDYFRCPFRNSNGADFRRAHVGFRVVRTLTP
jgi:formylglycine-generating enzyme required for sulfatase activity